MSRKALFVGFGLGCLLCMTTSHSLPSPESASPPAMIPSPVRMSGIPRPDQEAPSGSVRVRVVRENRLDNPDTQVQVTLVSLEEPSRVQQASTNAQGLALFTGLSPGLYQARLEASKPRVVSQPIQVFPAPAPGVRLLFNLPGSAIPLQPSALWIKPIFSLQWEEEQVRGRVSFEIHNTTDQLLDPGPKGLSLPLPDHATPLGISQGPQFSAPDAKLDFSPQALHWQGQIPPGFHEIDFEFTLPLKNGVLHFRQTASCPWQNPIVVFPHRAGLHFHADAPGFVIKRLSWQGTELWHVEAPQMETGKSLVFEIQGLPHESPWPARLVGGCALLMLGVFGIQAQRYQKRRPSFHREELLRRREVLLQELGILEQHPSTETNKREQIRTQLAELYRQIDAIEET